MLGVMQCGAVPVFVEPDEYYQLDANRIEAAITDKTREQCNNYGFDYAEGVSWIGEGPLNLQMTIHVNGSYKGSWFSITPYLSNIKGVNSCIIKECNIITLDNNVYKVAENTNFNELKLFTFQGKNIKEITTG